MADSIILATTRAHQARLYTLDADFKDLHDVELMQRP
jgi:predicted nucleic acid-binding protein